MKALKIILIALIVVLVVVVGAGATLVGFNHSGHNMTTSSDASQTKSNNQSNNSNQTNSNQEKQVTASNNQVNANNNSQENQNSKDGKTQTEQGNESKTPVVVAQEQVPPEDYLKQMQQAMDLIKQGTGLMTNAPSMSSSKSIPGDLKSQGTNASATDNSGDMSKMHEGIYKMAQGNTLMDQAIQNMNQEVKKARDNNISYYQVQPSNPQYFNNNPYLYFPNTNQYGMYPNQNYYNQNSNSQNQNNQIQGTNPQNDQGMQNHSNTNNNMNMDSTNGSMNMNMGSHSSLFSMINVQTITYIIYGFLFLSIIGVFFAIFGFINSLFKPTVNEEQRGESFAG